MIGALVGPSSHVGLAFGASGGTAYTLTSVSVGAFSAGAYPITLVGAVPDGVPVEWVLYSGTDPTTAAQVDAASWAGATVVASGTFPWATTPAPITLPGGIARANYKLVCITNSSGVLSTNVVISAPFEVDTVNPVLSSVSFTDNGSAQVAWSFTPSEASPTNGFRVSLWPSGTNPSAAAIESGAGASFTVTGTSDGIGADTGTLSSGAGTFQPTIWFSDIYGNETTATYSNVTVAASDPRLTDSGALYWFASDDTTRSGTDVTAINAKRGGFDLDTRPNPPFTSAIQQASAGAVMVFDGTRGLQTASSAAGNRKMINHMLGGGSNALRVFLVVNPNVADGFRVFFSESENETTNQSTYFGFRNVSGVLRFHSAARRFSSSWTRTDSTGLTVSTIGLCVMEWHITQTAVRIFVDGTEIGTSSAVTAGNFPNPGSCRTTLGALASATLASDPAAGDFREVYVTTTADDTTATAIRNAIIAQYGIS